jgi:hypothetical protein
MRESRQEQHRARQSQSAALLSAANRSNPLRIVDNHSFSTFSSRENPLKPYAV